MHVQTTFLAPEPPQQTAARTFNAAEATTLVTTWTDLTPQRRRDLASHLATAARMAALPPGALMLTPAVLRERVLDRSAAGHCVSTATMRNVLSGLRYVLRRLGAVDAIDRALDPAWTAQVALLPTRKQPGLVAFARFCSARAIAPAAVTVETLNTFEAHLVARTITGHASKTAGAVRGDWNRAVCRIPGWVGQPMEHRKQRGAYVLPPSAFPEEFRRSLAAFGQRLCATALGGFDDDPDADGEDGDARPLPSGRPLRASTAALRVDHVRWAASALVASGGVPLTEITSVAALVTPHTRARAAIRFLHDRAGQKPSAAGMHVAEVLRIVAKYDARLPAAQVAEIKRWGGPVRLAYRGMTGRNEREVAAAIDPRRLEQLLALPGALMTAARRLRGEAPEQARTLALRALAVGFLLHLPVRLANLRGLRLDQHLYRPDPRRGRITHLIVPAEETKNDRDIRLPIADDVAGLIEEWVSQHRLAPAPDRAWLFPHQSDPEKPMSPQGLRDAVKVATRNHAGAELSPHQFRHLAAKLFLVEFPGHYEEVRQLLGHASVATTIRHYAGEQTTVTARRYHEQVLGSLRSAGGNRRAKPATVKRGRGR